MRRVYRFIVVESGLLGTGVAVDSLTSVLPVWVWTAVTAACFTAAVALSWPELKALSGFKVRLPKTRRHKLYEALVEAVVADESITADPDNFDRVLDFQSKIEVVKSELEALGIQHNAQGLQHWSLIIRELREHAKRDDIEALRRTVLRIST